MISWRDVWLSGGPMAILKNIPQQFSEVKDTDEEFLWTGAPEFLPFFCMGLPFLVFGLLWGTIDYFGFIRNMEPGQSSFFTLFMAWHLFPLWGSILNLFRLILVYDNTFYAITNKRVMTRSGFWGTDFNAIDYDKITDVQVTVNPLENMIGVGSVTFSSGKFDSDPLKRSFIGVAEPYEVFKKVKTVSVDVKTDWNYPNKLRPDENPGYRTKYDPKN